MRINLVALCQAQLLLVIIVINIYLLRTQIQLVVAGRGKGGISPQAPAEGAPKEGVVTFLRHEIYINSVSSVEAGMGMAG